MASCGKRKRIVVSMERRLDALKRMDKGESLKSIASSFGVGESTVSDWKKKRNEIESFCSELACKGALETRSTLKKPKLDKLDDALLLWFNQERAKGMTISGPIIKEKAMMLHQKMSGDYGFQASEGWLNRWKKRHGINRLTISEEKLSVDNGAAVNFSEKFEYLVGEKALSDEQIYNVDETGLYYRLFPSKTLASRKENALLCYENNKDRLTVSVCVNAAGTHKLPVMLVGKSAKPRALRNVNVNSLPVHYRSSKTAMMNQSLFKEWFHSEFAPAVEKHLVSKNLPAKALLILDNAPSHPSEDHLKVGDIEALFLPPNMTPLTQPLNQGVIESLKRRYRRKLLTAMCEEDSCGVSVTDLLKTVSIKDVIYMIAESWSELPESTLVKSWQKFWTQDQSCAEETDISSNLSTDDFVVAFKSLSGCEDVDAEDVEQWLGIDKDLQQEALSDDDIIGTVTDITQDDEDADFDDNSTSLVTHMNGLNALETALCYVEQQESASPVDVMLLRKWRNYASSNRISHLRQKKIADYFQDFSY